MLTSILLFLLKLTAIVMILPFTFVFGGCAIVGVVLIVGAIRKEARDFPSNFQKVVRYIRKDSADDGCGK